MLRLPYTLPYFLKPIITQKIDSDKGIGDTVERLIHKTGLDSLSKTYEKLTGRNCGCNNRKEWLNNRYPY